MYKILISAKDNDNLPIGFDRDCGRRRDELSRNEKLKGKYHIRLMLKDDLGFAEDHEKATSIHGNKLTIRKVMMKPFWTKLSVMLMLELNVIICIGMCPITHHSFNIKVIAEQISCKTTTELQYIGRSNFMKEVNDQNL